MSDNYKNCSRRLVTDRGLQIEVKAFRRPNGETFTSLDLAPGSVRSMDVGVIMDEFSLRALRTQIDSALEWLDAEKS